MLSKARAGSLNNRDELNRILDPSYTSSSHIASSTYGAYVDAQGHMHDPDYRHFPLIQQSSQYSAKRRGTKSSNRPHWELVDEEAGLLTDDDDILLQEDNEGYYAKRNSWTVKPTASSPRHYSPSRRSSYPPRSNAYSGAILSPADVSPPTSWSSSSAYSQSSSPASTSSSVLQQQRSSPFEASSEKGKCRISTSLSRKRRSSAATAISTEKKAKRTSHEYDDGWYTREEEPVAEEEEEAEEDVVPRDYPTDDEDEEPRRVVEEDGDCVPSCTDALKRRWQALSLSIRFGMFRAERRIKRRVQSLI